MALTEVLKTGPSASAVFTPIGTEDASASSSTFSPMLVRSPTSHECLPAARPVLSRPGRCMWAVHWTQATPAAPAHGDGRERCAERCWRLWAGGKPPMGPSRRRPGHCAVRGGVWPFSGVFGSM